MISKSEKNRIIRLRRQTNYMRFRSENGDLSSKQQTQSQANANAMSWSASLAIRYIENREIDEIKAPIIDFFIKRLRLLRFSLHRTEYEKVRSRARDLALVEIMEHEGSFDGQAKETE